MSWFYWLFYFCQNWLGGSPTFQPFFCCFRHFSMLFLFWKPWFYCPGGSPTFFTDFLTIFVLIKEKASVLSQKLKLFFEYLNHICNPAFAVHPCPSPIFCHQEDKSELRGATPHFLPRLSPKPAQEWLPANFTVHSDFSSTVSAIRLLSPATSVIGRFLHRQSRVHYWLYLCHTSCHTDTP